MNGFYPNNPGNLAYTNAFLARQLNLIDQELTELYAHAAPRDSEGKGGHFFDRVWNRFTISDLVSKKMSEIQGRLDLLASEVLFLHNSLPSLVQSAETELSDIVELVTLVNSLATLSKKKGPFGSSFNPTKENDAIEKTAEASRLFFNSLPDSNNDQAARATVIKSLEPLKNSDPNTYYNTLATVIEKFKIPIHELDLTFMEYRELGPYLTYVEINYNLIDKKTLGKNYLINEILKSAENMRVCVLTQVDLGMAFGLKYSMPSPIQTWCKLESLIVTGGELPLQILTRFPVLKELMVEDAKVQETIPFGSIPCLEKLSLRTNPPYSEPIPQNVFQLLAFRLKAQGTTIDISLPHNFISYLHYLLDCRQKNEKDELNPVFPDSALLQSMSIETIRLLIDNYQKWHEVLAKNIYRFPDVTDFLFQLLLLPVPRCDMNHFSFCCSIQGTAGLMSDVFKNVYVALSLLRKYDQNSSMELNAERKELLTTFFISDIGKVWLRHNFFKIINNPVIWNFIIKRSNTSIVGTLCKLFVEYKEKLSEKNWLDFKRLLATTEGTEWATTSANLYDPGTRDTVYSVYPSLRIRYYCLHTSTTIPDDELPQVEETFQKIELENGFKSFHIGSIFSHPQLRPLLYKFSPDLLCEFFLKGVDVSNREEIDIPFREFLKSEYGTKWCNIHWLEILDADYSLRKILFDECPWTKTSLENYLNSDQASDFIENNISWLWDHDSFRRILFANYTGLVLSIAANRYLSFTKDELEAINRFKATPEGTTFFDQNRDPLLCHFSLRPIVGMDHPQDLFSFFIDRGKSVSISDEEFKIIEQFSNTIQGREWMMQNKLEITKVKPLRRLLWEADINAMIPFFLQNAKKKPTDKEKEQLACLIQGRGPAVAEVLDHPLKDIKNPHLRKLVVRYVPAMFLKDVLFDSAYILTKKEQALLLGYLKLPEGRTSIKNHLLQFLEHNKLRPLLYQAYPPTNLENRDLYPTGIGKNGSTLLFQIYPALPLLEPDSILQAMLDKQPFESIRIIHYDSPAIDQSGLSKQFLSQLMQGLPKSRLIPFELTDAGYLQPRDTGAKMSSDQEQALALLGRLLGLAIKNRYPLGLIFSSELIRALYLGSSPFETIGDKNPITKLLYIKDTYDQMLPQVENTGWQDQLDPDTENHPYQLMKIVCQHESRVNAFQAAEKLNFLWDSEEIRSAIQADDLPKLQNLVLDTWFADHKRYYDTLKIVALGMMESLPFDINGIQITQWQDLEHITVEDFSAALLGQISADYIKERLQFVVTGNIQELAIDERRGWFFEWIDAHANDQKALANFIHGLTGAPALAGKITIRLITTVDGIKSQTCFNTVNLHPDYPKEVLINDFNDYASGKFPTFDSL